jgi:hypothetical protein
MYVRYNYLLRNRAYNDSMRNFWLLAIIIFVACFTSACDQLKVLKTSLENNEVTITIGEETNVEVFAKEGADVTWETEDPSIVTVENGTFSAVGEGTTYVVVKSGDSQTKIKVTVVPRADEETFTITWLDRDGTVLEVDEKVLKGVMPTFDGQIPPHDGLEFKGWDPEVVPVEGDATYTAKYKAPEPTYTITWKNWDGSTLATSVVYGAQTPIYSGPAPTKESDDYYDYMFAGWSPKVGPANYIRTYTAQFTGIRKTYTVTWEHPLDGVIYTATINAGDYAIYNRAEPTFPDDPVTGVRKKFYGWSPNANNTKILKDTTFLAEFREVHKITWTNEGVILKEEEVFKGDTPEYVGPEPTRPSDLKYSYTFKDWSPAIDVVKNEDIVYDATYDCFLDPSREFEFEESWRYGGLRISNYKLKDTGEEVVIPLWYDGQRINEIGDNAFEGSQKLKKVTISEGLLWINSEAFKDCKALEDFKFGSKITHIEEETFKGCTALSKIDIDVPVVKIGAEAFRDCINLEIVDFSEGLETIEWSAFENCVKLSGISFPDSLEKIQTAAFYGCSDLISLHFALGGNLKYIGGSAFAECTSLLTMEIPASVENIYNNAFDSCSNLGLIVFNEGLKWIGKNVFKDCVKLRNFDLPSTLLEIGDYAFSNCQGITKVVIPKDVTEIGAMPFKDCKNIASISVDANNTVYDSRSACNAIIITETKTLIVACKNSTIPDGVVRIASGAFYKIDIKQVTIPASVRYIERLAFYLCNELPHYLIEKGKIQPITETSIVTVFVPKTVETIEAEAFYFDTGYGAGGSITGSQYIIHTDASSEEPPKTNWSTGQYGHNWCRGCYLRYSNGAYGWYW